VVASKLLGGDFVGEEMVWWQDDPKPYLMHLMHHSCQRISWKPGFDQKTVRDLGKR